MAAGVIFEFAMCRKFRVRNVPQCAANSDFRVDNVSKPNEKVGRGLQTNAIQAEVPMTPAGRLFDLISLTMT